MEYYDNELGRLQFRVNDRAKRFIFRTLPDGVLITIPKYSTIHEAMQALEKLRDRLIQKKGLVSKQFFDETSEMRTNTFSVRIFRTERANFYFSRKDDILHIACPKDTDFSKTEIQSLLRSGIEKMLKIEAKRILPERLNYLSKKHGFTFSGLKINGSKSRWGSCSGRKDINLSFYLMLLPDRLIDYVLLHELCHTIEMNHSPAFWAQMDAVTNNMSKELRNDLKQYKTGF